MWLGFGWVGTWDPPFSLFSRSYKHIHIHARTVRRLPRHRHQQRQRPLVLAPRLVVERGGEGGTLGGVAVGKGGGQDLLVFCILFGGFGWGEWMAGQRVCECVHMHAFTPPTSSTVVSPLKSASTSIMHSRRS